METWSKYFRAGEIFIGCDIDERCGSLKYDDDRIKIVVGNVTLDETRHAILSLHSEFDIVIDDGSHESSDIVRTFSSYFPMVKPGGLYIVEDTHALYWPNYGGGVTNGRSAQELFKKLTDVLNFDFWRQDRSIESHLAPFFADGALPEFIPAGWIESIEFRNSLIVITKALRAGHDKLGLQLRTGSIGL